MPRYRQEGIARAAGSPNDPASRHVDGRQVRIVGIRRGAFGKLKLGMKKPDPDRSEVSSEDNVPAVTEEGQLAAVTADRDRLAAENADLNDRFLRLRAEFDNARRRFEQQRSEYIQFAATDLIKEILPVVDDFERALQVETADSNYAKGVQLIYQRLQEILKRLGLEPMNTVGQQFDPNRHQAVERVHTETEEDQTILGEFQRGYLFKGKLLRPAMVKVAVKP